MHSDPNAFRINEEIANILEAIHMPIITISFLQSAVSKSKAQLLIACLCQSRMMAEYSIHGMHISLFEYTIHQTTITLMLICLQDFTMRKELMKREEKLLFMTLLLSSIVVYDTGHSSKEVLKQEDLHTFMHLVELKHQIKETGHFIKPKLLWLYEEKMPSSDGSQKVSSATISAALHPDLNFLNDRFEQALSHVDSTKDAKLKFAIKKCFPTRSCFVIPEVDNSYEGVHETSKHFLDGILTLRHHLANPSNIKKISTSMENVKINGRTFVNFLTQLVGCVNRDETFLAPRVSKEIISSDSNVLYQQIADKHAFKLEQLRHRLPIDHIELEEWNRRRIHEAVQELQRNAADRDHSDRILRQLISQLEGTLTTEFYKLLRENENLCRVKSEEVLQRLYQKLDKRLESYKTVEQFNKDVADMKTSFWHQSIGPEKQNIWIQFNASTIQKDLLQLRRRIQDGRRGGMSGSVRDTADWNRATDDSYGSIGSGGTSSRSPTRRMRYGGVSPTMTDSSQRTTFQHNSNSGSGRHHDKLTTSFLEQSAGVSRSNHLGGHSINGKILPERYASHMARLRGGASGRSPKRNTPAYASPTASSSRHTRTKFPRLNG